MACLENIQVMLSSPVLNEGELESLMKDKALKTTVLSTYFDIRKGLDGSLGRKIQQLCEEADAAVCNGSQLLVLSDRSEGLVSHYCFFFSPVLHVVSNLVPEPF
jgi:Glutamate synthase central domain